MVRVVVFFALAGAGFAQVRETVEWTVALRGRMAQMSNPVVRVHGTAGLARALCPVDQGAASSLYRDAISSLFNMPAGAFSEKGTAVLPVASFSGLWKFVIPAALKCDPGLAAVAENQRARERVTAERTGANATLRRAYALLSPDMPLDKQTMMDRAAQIGQAAVEAGDPETLDLPLLSLLLSTLNVRAPDLADDLFLRSLELVMSDEAPSPDGLQTLAKFLFTSRDLVDTPDDDQRGRNFVVSGATVENFASTRASANPDNIEALIDATLHLLTIPNAVNRNPVVAFALAYQLLPRARDLMPDRADDLEKAIAQLQAENPNSSAQVQSQIGALDRPDQEGGDRGARVSWLVSQVRSALAGGRTDAARELLPRIDDAPARGQLTALTNFTEAAIAIEKHGEEAIGAANQLSAGIKRSLLYVSYIANCRRLDLALQVLALAHKDIAPLPAEQRVRLLSALGTALLRVDLDSVFGVLDRLVVAYNDVRVSPRKGRFDPTSIRRGYSPNSSSAGDSALILVGQRGFYEAVQTQRGRHNFVLRTPGVDAFTIGAFLGAAKNVDRDRLGAFLTSLRDENTQAAAWVKLAEVRLAAARSEEEAAAKK